MSSAAAAAAVGFPKWVLLEPYVFRRDDDASFPDGAEAPITASGTTSWGADFRVAFSLAEPPFISRLYAKLPGFPAPNKASPLLLLAAHRRLALFDIVVSDPSEVPLHNFPSDSEDPVQDFFIFRADIDKPSSFSVRSLPPCSEPQYKDSRRLRRGRRPPSKAPPPRMLDTKSLGLWCGDQEEFVVAELTVHVATTGRRTKAFADICSLRSSFTDSHLGGRKWNTIRLPILHTTDDDLWMLSRWQTDGVVPFQQSLCWIDYHQGILFWNLSEKAHGGAPSISVHWFPLDEFSHARPEKTLCSGNGGVSVADHGRSPKFVHVVRHDGLLAHRPLQPGTSFTMTCYTFVAGGRGVWNKDYTVTSDDLPDHLQRGIPMSPRVDIVRPQVVHSLFIEFREACKNKKMSVISIDMSTKTVESFYLYMDGSEHIHTHYKHCPPNVDIYFIQSKCMCPIPRPLFLCEFPGFCYSSRKRNDVE